MSNSNRRAEIKVLIAGAGIAGLSTAIALGRLDGPDLSLDIQLFDKAEELREIGASIALSPNGLRTLERLGVEDALTEDVGFRGPNPLPMIYHHWKTDEVVSSDRFVDVPDRKHQTARFHRGHLHSTLLGHVPRDTIHLCKAVESVVVHDDDDAVIGVSGGGGGGGRGGYVTLLFKDGTSATGDVLVGADGLRSKVRRTFVPHHELHYTGRTWIRSTFDSSLVEDIPNLPPDPVHWWGPRHTFFASRLGRNMYTTVGNYDPSDFPERQPHHWDQEGDLEFFQNLYAGWNPVVEALAQVTPHVRMYPNLAGEPLDSWVFRKRVTLVGDAAHTHGGAHAAGGSLALDDAWALSLGLKHVLDPSTTGDRRTRSGGGKLGGDEIELAFKLYEKTRRPHTTRLVKSVLATKAAAVVPNTDEELREKMKNRPSMTWLTEHDVEATFARVLENEKGNVDDDDDERQVEKGKEGVMFGTNEAMNIPGSESVVNTETKSTVMVK